MLKRINVNLDELAMRDIIPSVQKDLVQEVEITLKLCDVEG
jgi:hypothetical protein